MKTIAITDAAAEHIIGASYSVDDLLRSEQGAKLAINRIREGDICYIVTGRERANFKYAMLDADEFRKVPTESMRDALPRIDRALKATARFPLRFPPSWSEFHAGNKVAFFALPRESHAGLRWIAQYDSTDERLLFRKITTTGAEIALKVYSEPLPKSVRAQLQDHIDKLRTSKDSEESRPSALIETFDFDVVGAEAISGVRTFEEWRPKLKGGQLSLLELPPLASARIIGPAGSGKTLALCLRALDESRRANQDGRRIKLLFATHSWAMAERVDRTIAALNGHTGATDIVVLPLIQALKQALSDTYAGATSVLGDDSTEGRQLQRELVSDVIAGMGAVEVEVFSRHGLSSEIVEKLNAGGSNREELIEDLCEEFTGVLLAENVMPGDRDAEERYLKAERSDEMPPFRTRGDRMFALSAYRGYLLSLREWGAITTDQLVNDSIRVLETFSWSVRRDVEGFDAIFVDELQLFDAQERLAVTLLTRNPSSATFVTAEDPSQGVFSAVSAAWRRELPARNESTELQLSTVHRFNGKILEFIRHLYLSFPLNANSVTVEQSNGKESGSEPILHVLSDGSAVDAAVIASAKKSLQTLGKGERLAIIALDGYGICN